MFYPIMHFVSDGLVSQAGWCAVTWSLVSQWNMTLSIQRPIEKTKIMTGLNTMQDLNLLSQHPCHYLRVYIHLQMLVLLEVQWRKEWQITLHGATNIIQLTLSHFRMTFCWNLSHSQICLHTQRIAASNFPQKLPPTCCNCSHWDAWNRMSGENTVEGWWGIAGESCSEYYIKQLTKQIIHTPFNQNPPHSTCLLNPFLGQC